jgi:hypothetical protein
MSVFGRVTVSDLAASVRQIVNLLQRPMWANPSTGAVRLVDVVTSVVNLQQLQYVSGVAAPVAGLTLAYDALVINPMRTTWALNVRSRITDT